MNSITRFGVFLLLTLNFSVQAITLEDLKQVLVTDEFKVGKDHFDGDWKGRKDWRGWFCRNYYQYRGAISGDIQELELSLQPEGHIDVSAMLENVEGDFFGAYRSGYTACLPVSHYFSAAANWIDVRGRADLDVSENGEEVKLKVRVKHTEIGHLDLRSIWLPNFVEKTLTYLTNKALAQVWSSRLGDWIGDFITRKMEEASEKKTM